ncbi:hypothetical protein B0H63DRAFT_534037 [Podospora didyma]|uniref:SnoaL-like domain-containing protein n=1 Tax=Podospora didyma TaxID=330526 RepID=A0AAE0P8K6_9PEZI|nr:hypothetical protein B0H63DRAFT_534037 [Podospora didyma]
MSCFRPVDVENTNKTNTTHISLFQSSTQTISDNEFPTKPAFIADAIGWEGNRAHSVWRWLDEHTVVFHEKNFEDCKPYYASDFVFVKSTGEVITDEAVGAFHSQYALFDSFFHEPVYSTIVATDDGHRLMGSARLFVNLLTPNRLEGGVEEEGKKHVDMHGRKWDYVGQAVFFDAVTDPASPHGRQFTQMQAYMDPLHILASAVERSVIPAEVVLAG